jgi:hypothetical protein
MTDQQTTSQNEGETLYAGKFKTVAELEAGYKNSLPVFQENQTLKAKLDEVSKVPDDYMTPADVALHDDDLADVKRIAKNSELTQAQFDKLARETYAKGKGKLDAFENAKKDLGADTLNMLQDYVKKYYPEKIGDSVLKKLIMEKDAREIALQHRNTLLNSKVPGVGDINPGAYAVTQKDVMKAREDMLQSRGKARVEAQKKYISLQSQLAHAKG